jgi:hypothetical protein
LFSLLQHLAYYRTHRRSPRWWLSLFFYMWDCAIVNAWLLFHHRDELKQRNVDQLSFRSALIKELVGDFCGRKRAGRPAVAAAAAAAAADPRRYDLTRGHWHRRLEKRSTAQCACGCGVRPYYHCSVCEVPLTLDCFEHYHTRS